MVYENNLPPIENKKPFETVYELKESDYKIKTSKLSLAARSKIIKKYGSDYLSERAFAHDLALMEMYGPGWGEWILKTTIVVGGSFVLGPIPAIVVGGATAGAATIAESVVDDPDAKKVFGFISDVGKDIAVGGAVGGLVQGVGGVLAADLGGAGSNVGRSAAIKALKTTGDIAVARSEYLFAASKHGAKVVGDIDKWFSLCKDLVVATDEAEKHLEHVRDGYSYRSWCKVCTA